MFKIFPDTKNISRLVYIILAVFFSLAAGFLGGWLSRFYLPDSFYFAAVGDSPAWEKGWFEWQKLIQQKGKSIVIEQDQQAAADKARAKARAEVTANSSDARWADLRELAAAADGLALTEALYASPQAVLARAGLGDPRRTDLLKQLSGAGPAELRQMAALAVATKDAVLGAVLQTVNDRLPRRDRPISSAQLAAALVGDETRAVQAAVAGIKATVQRAIVANRDFERGRASALDKVKLALQQKESD